MRRKVLVCAPRLFSDGRAGGGERYATEFINALCRRDEFEVAVVTGVGYRGLERREPLALDQASPLTLRAFREMVARSDLVHLFQLDSHIADLTLLSAMPHRTQVVLSDLGGGWPAAGRLLGRARHLLIDGLAAISETSIEDLGWRRGRRPTTVLYGGGDHLSPGPPSAERYDFVFVGRLVEHKGAHLLVDALPDGASCLIAGAPLDPTYVEALRARAPSGRVAFTLGPSDAEVVAAYGSAKWCVCPTLAHVDGKALRRPELLGLTPIESLALGTPVVLSDIPAYAELAALVGMPTFSADDGTSLRQVLERVMRDSPPDLAASRAEFSWDTVAAKSVRLYEQISDR